jgi:hypothetical protein
MRSKLLTLITLLALVSCSDIKLSSTGSEEAPSGPIVVVKIDDTSQAHPQVGIEKADLIFIEQVEGGLVRLAAIFSTEIPEKIGPVRSARISDIDLLAQFGKVAFFYSGAQRIFLPVIKASNLFDLGAQHESPKLYTRDLSRLAPYDMVLDGAEILNRISKLDVSTTKNLNLKFDEFSKKGKKIDSFKVHWPAANYSGIWNGTSWDLSQNGSPDFTSSGMRLSPATFIIQNVVITDSEYKDKLGGVTPFSATIGEGTGWVLRNGFAIKAVWNRPDAESRTSWSDLAGNEISFAAGQVWVALTDQTPEFTVTPTKK